MVLERQRHAQDWAAEQFESLKKLAEVRFGHLHAAEQEMFRGAIVGDFAYCGPSEDDDDPHNNPSHAETWGPKRQIRADVLRWLCTNRAAEGFVDLEGIIIHGAKIVGDLYLSSASLRFPLEFWRCRFSDQIQLVSARIASLRLSGSLTASIVADGLKANSDVFLDQGFITHAEVSLIGAEIDGNLQCDGGIFSADAEESGSALNLQNINVKGDIFLSDGFQAQGKVSLMGGRVGGYLSCGGGTFKNPLLQGVEESGTAIDAEFVNVAQNLELNDGFQAEGSVSLLGAHIGGDLDCRGGLFKNPAQNDIADSGAALGIEYVTVNGSISLSEGFRSEGDVDLLGAQITGDLECDGASFGNVNAQRIGVRQTLFWRNIKDPQRVTLDLEDGSVGSLVDDRRSWPAKGNLSLDGFTYGSLAENPLDQDTADKNVSEAPADPASRLEWLARQNSFAPQPYRQLARILRDDGDDRGARRVLFEMEDRKHHLRRHPWPARLWYSVFQLTIGYGIYPRQAVWGLLLLVALGWVIYRPAYFNHLITPTNETAYKAFRANGKAPDYYQLFYPLVYSAENSFPLVKLGQSDAWTTDPSRADPLASSVRYFRWSQVVLGWILATFFVAGVSGIARKD